MKLAGCILVTAAALCASAGAPSTPAYERAQADYSRADYGAVVVALKANAGDAKSLELLGQSYYMLGEFQKATDTLQKAASAAPNDSMIQTWLGRAWGMRAESSSPFSAMSQAGKAREAFERALKLDPSNNEALGDLFDYYMDAPGIVGGGMDKAEALLPLYAQYDPLGLHIARARIAEKKQQYPAAEANLRKAVDTAPRHVSIVLELAQFLSRRGRFDESEKVFQHAAEIAPNAPRILYARASSYIKAKRNIGQAQQLLKTYVASSNLTPDDPAKWEAQKLLKKTEGL